MAAAEASAIAQARTMTTFLAVDCPEHGEALTSEEVAVLELDPVMDENSLRLRCAAGGHPLIFPVDEEQAALVMRETNTLTILKEYT